MNYGSVVDFAFSIAMDRIVGHAAPAHGPNPSGVVLRADGELIQAATASRFSSAAFDAGLRLGWCGFEIAGASEAFALADDVTLHCSASGRELARLDFSLMDQAGMETGVVSTISVMELLGRIRSIDAATDISQILPFAELFLRKTDFREFIETTFIMLLNRRPNFDFEDWTFNLLKRGTVQDFLSRVSTCEEYKSNPLSYIPGPFDAKFRYGLDIFS